MACFALLVVTSSACSKKHEPKPRMGDVYPENLAFVQERCSRVGFFGLRPRERVVYCLGCFQAEMKNGGFHQFFLSSAGDHTGATREALEAVGATKVKDLLAKAIDVAFEGYMVPLDRAARVQQLKRPSQAYEQQLADQLAAVDEEYDVAAESLVDLTNHWLERSK